MLYRYINQFVEYCQLADFSVRSIQALDIRLNEFKAFLKSQKIQSVKKITYLRLVDFGVRGVNRRLDPFPLTVCFSPSKTPI